MKGERQMKHAAIRKIKGSALVWVIAVLAILIILVLSAVTVSLAFATRVSKDTLKAQMEYTSRSAINVLADEYCTGLVYNGTSAVSGFDVMNVGDVAGPVKLEFTSPEAKNPMGICNAYFTKEDDETVIISATTNYESITEATVEGVIKKKNVLAVPMICTDSLELGMNSTLDFADGSSIVLQDSSLTCDDANLQILTGSASVVYTSLDAAEFASATVNPPLSDITASFAMPSGKYQKLGNGKISGNSNNKFIINKNYSKSMDFSGGDYYFTAESDISIGLDISNDSTDVTRVFIDMGDNDCTVNIKNLSENVLLYVNGESTTVNIENDVEINGALYAKSVTAADDITATITYVSANDVVSVFSSEIGSYIWEFVRYREAQ